MTPGEAIRRPADPDGIAELFDTTDLRVAPAAPDAKLSPDRRRTLRQSQTTRSGGHPLGLALGYPIALHPDASRDPEDRDTGPRCGSCWYRDVLGHHNRSYSKCTFGATNTTDTTQGSTPRITHGAGTDLRAWWPACRDYSPSDSLSPDAARWTP